MSSGWLEKLRPDIWVNRVEDLDLEMLKERGIKGLLLDLDNTLCAWGTRDLPAERQAWVARARERYAVCLLSNTIKGRRLRAMGELLGVPVVGRWGLGRKPLAGGFRAALKLTGTAPAETCMVGDQLFADIWGGNRLGLLTVRVEPLAEREFISTQIMRRLERWVLRRLGAVETAVKGDKDEA